MTTIATVNGTPGTYNTEIIRGDSVTHDMHEEVKRFVVIVQKGHYYSLVFFDKEIQTDAMDSVEIAIEPGSVQLVGAMTTAWLLMGMLVRL